MTLLGNMKNKVKCPVCKRCYLNIYSDGEKYCPNCGQITVESKEVMKK